MTARERAPPAVSLGPTTRVAAPVPRPCTLRLLRLRLCLPALAIFGAVSIADTLLYGRPVLPVLGFVRFNFRWTTGVCAYYGTHLWHLYLGAALPSILATHLPLLSIGLRAATAVERRLLAALVLLDPLLSSRPHKELRFLLPILPIAFAFCCRGIASLPPRRYPRDCSPSDLQRPRCSLPLPRAPARARRAHGGAPG